MSPQDVLGRTTYRFKLVERAGDEERLIGGHDTPHRLGSWSQQRHFANTLGFFKVEAIEPIGFEEASDYDGVFIVKDLGGPHHSAPAAAKLHLVR